MTAEEARKQSESIKLTKGNRFKERVEVIEYWIGACSKMGDTYAYYFRILKKWFLLTLEIKVM